MLPPRPSHLPTVDIPDVLSVNLYAPDGLFLSPLGIVQVRFPVGHQVPDLTAHPKGKARATPLSELDSDVRVCPSTAIVHPVLAGKTMPIT